MSIKEILKISKDNFGLLYSEIALDILFFRFTDTNKRDEIIWQGSLYIKPPQYGYHKDNDLTHIIWHHLEKTLKESPEFKNKFEEYVRPYGVIYLI